MIQTEAINEVHQGNKLIYSDTRCEQDNNIEIVGRWILQSAYKSKRSLRRQSLYGKRLLISYSTKQKLNTQRSIESKIFGVGDFMTGIIWMRNLFKDQDYGIAENISFQDNTSALIL